MLEMDNCIENSVSVPSSISVVCPSYNSAEYILRTLRSIAGQTVKPLEVIISDDGSTDNTREIVAEFILACPDLTICWIENSHRGPGAARNSGILAAKGEWIAFIDSDDTWFPNKLAFVTKIIQQNPEINLICNAEEHIRMNGNKTMLDFGKWYVTERNLFQQLYHVNFLSPSAVTCKRQMLIDVGLFNEQLMSSQDYELWLRMSFKIRPYFIREKLGSYYDRAGNISTTKAFRRLRNNILIAAKFRHQAGLVKFLYKVGYLVVVFFWQYVNRGCKI